MAGEVFFDISEAGDEGEAVWCGGHGGGAFAGVFAAIVDADAYVVDIGIIKISEGGEGWQQAVAECAAGDALVGGLAEVVGVAVFYSAYVQGKSGIVVAAKSVWGGGV